jgi:hypothetical protein
VLSATERIDALFDRRMREKEAPESARITPRDPKRRHLLRKILMDPGVQPLQRRDHLLASSQTRAAGIGPELALPGEPHHDRRCQDSEDDLGDDRGDEEGRVIMSPLAMWEISWPSTASISSRPMRWSRPLLTATSAASLRAPVAKALGASDGKIAT